MAPTVAEVAEYARGLGYRGWAEEAERFVAFYSSKGWMVGRNKMRDWQAAVVGWQTRRKAEVKAKTPKEVLA